VSSPAYFVAIESDQGFACQVAGSEVQLLELTWPQDEEAGADWADAVAKALDDLGYDGRGLVLGLASDRIFATEVSTEGLPRRGRHEALLYRLEENLPLDAETLTADFLSSVGGRTLGIAVETEPTRTTLDRLAEVGVQVEAIYPTALLSLWHMCQNENGMAHVYLAHLAGRIEIFRVSEGRPVAWYSVAPGTDSVCQAIHASFLTRPAETDEEVDLVSGPMSAEFLDAVTGETGLACRRVVEEPCVALAARAVPVLLKGERAGWVNLRRDTLGPTDRLSRVRQPLQTAITLALALLVVLSAGAWWRATQYDAETMRLIAAQGAVFREVYPNHEVPHGVHRWLASEAKRLSGLSGTEREVPEQPAALETLRDVARGFPDGIRFRLLLLRVEPTEVLLEGEARDHATAEAVARGIAARGFAMELPRTENLEKGGVAFTLVGEPSGPESERQSAGETP